MTRTSSAAVISALGASAHDTAHLVEVQLDAQTYYLTDYYRKLTILGNEYSPVGHLLGIDGVEDVARLENNQVSVSLSGVDQNYISVFLSQEYIDRPLRIYRVWINGSGNIVGERVLIFDGRIDQPVIQENPDDGLSTITLQVTSHWIDFERVNVRRYSNEEQQFRYANDKGFEFVSEIPLDLIWGRK